MENDVSQYKKKKFESFLISAIYKHIAENEMLDMSIYNMNSFEKSLFFPPFRISLLVCFVYFYVFLIK